MSDFLHVRLWINDKLEVDEDLTVNAEDSAIAHAFLSLGSLAAGKPYLLEISDPDLSGKVLFRSSSDPSKLERPLSMEQWLRERKRAQKPWEN